MALKKITFLEFFEALIGLAIKSYENKLLIKSSKLSSVHPVSAKSFARTDTHIDDMASERSSKSQGRMLSSKSIGRQGDVETRAETSGTNTSYSMHIVRNSVDICELFIIVDQENEPPPTTTTLKPLDTADMSLNNTHFQDTMIAAVMTGTVGTATTGIVTAASNLINQVDAIINEENENLNEAELEIKKWVHMNHLFFDIKLFPAFHNFRTLNSLIGLCI